MAVRASLLAEHLGRDVEEVRRSLEQGSMIDTIEAMRGDGRSLRAFKQEDSAELGEFVLTHNLLDPIGEDQAQCETMAIRPRFYQRFNLVEEQIEQQGGWTQASADSMEKAWQKAKK